MQAWPGSDSTHTYINFFACADSKDDVNHYCAPLAPCRCIIMCRYDGEQNGRQFQSVSFRSSSVHEIVEVVAEKMSKNGVCGL